METTTRLGDLIAITNRLIDLMGKEIEMAVRYRAQIAAPGGRFHGHSVSLYLGVSL